MILSQIIGFFAVVFFVFSINNKDKSRVLNLQAVANLLYTISYFLIGVFSAGLMNLVSMIRCLVFSEFSKNKQNIPSYWLWLFLSMIMF